jgi:hypothetical protein
MAAKTTAAPRDTIHTIAKVIAYGMFAGALALSASHIIGLFELLGAASLTACVMPIFIDGVALLGRLARSDRFAAQTRCTGLKVQIVASVISLIANVVAGHTVGDKVAGVMVVAGYVFAEWFADQLKPVEVDVAADRAAAKAAAVAKAAATRKANAEAKKVADAAKAEAARSRRERKALDAKAAAPAAQVTEVIPATRYI